MSAAMERILKHADLVAAVAVVLVVVMMIVPLPPIAIDLFITLNISSAIALASSSGMLASVFATALTATPPSAARTRPSLRGARYRRRAAASWCACSARNCGRRKRTSRRW